jgi:predicted extracellular nuclease
MKKKILALAIGGVLSAGTQASINDVLITEFIEGGNSSKRALELTNIGSDSITFDSSHVITTENNDGSARTPISLDGSTIAAGETLVILPSSPDQGLLDAIALNQAENSNILKSSNAKFYGYNYIALNQSGTDLDSLGTSGAKSAFSVDTTIRRRVLDSDGTIPPQSNTYDPAQWEALAKDTFDGAGSPTLSEASISAELKTINEIQDGYFDGLKVQVTGTVSAVFTSAVKGFYIYQESNDGLPTTSDGLFVNSEAFKLDDDSRLIAAGDVVTLVGTISESYGQTELKQIESQNVDSSGGAAPAAVDLKMIKADDGSFKNMMRRYDGMFVNLPADIDQDDTSAPDDTYTGKSGEQTMRVTQPYTKDWDNYSNNIHLAYESIKIQPNQENVAGSQDAIDAIAENKQKTLIVEADNSKNTIDIIDYYPDFNPKSATDYDATKHAIRINDGVVGLKGAVKLEYGTYTLYVPQGPEFYATKDTFVKNTPRTDKPVLDLSSMDSDEFPITIATQNVLNLFNSPFGGDANLHGDNRGADTQEEYDRQKAKIVTALRALDADILGLMEIENNGFGTFGTIAELVATVNEFYTEDKSDEQDDADAISKRYVFVAYDSDGNTIIDSEDSIGSDAITSGILYRPAKVSLKGSNIISMPQQHAPTIVNDNNQVVKDGNDDVLESGDNYMRNTVAAEFAINQTGKRLTVAVNHFKSKGSTCWEDWQGTDFGDTVQWKSDPADDDQQGNCENFRVAAAVQLGTELGKMGGDQVIIGDFNSYAKEDPMLVLTKNETDKTLTAARDTFIGKTPQFGSNGANITKSYGFLNAVSMKESKDEPSWSYIWNDEVGSLDHLLMTASLKDRLEDAKDWHINSSEAPLLDYNFEYKGDGLDGESETEDDNGAIIFYKDDAFRSSDHDSAVMVLSYKSGETDGNRVYLAINSGLINVPYSIPASAGVKVGDMAIISLKPQSDNISMNDVVIPITPIKSSALSLTNIEVKGLDAGNYSATMYLERDGQKLANSQVSLPLEVSKQDSLTPKIVINESDNSGGSFGIFGIMSLLGLGFLRRKTK